MKRLILSILISFLVLFVFAQNTPVKVVRIENATTAFGSNLSIGDQVYNIASGELWVAKTGVIGTATLTTASASFNRVNGGVSDVTSSTTSQLTVTNGTTSPSLSIITGAVTNNGTSLTTGGQVYNFVTGQGYLSSETDPSVKAVTGLVKSNGTTVSAAVAGTDYLTPTGSAASLTGFPTFNQNTTGTASNVTGIVAGANGGTGVANTGKTITLGGNLTTSGAFPTTLTSTAATTVTLPTTGTLATLAGTEALTNKTINGLTPTAAATGFTIAGGTTSKTLTVSDNATVSGTNTGDQVLPTLASLGAVAGNAAITAGTNTKITYDAKGLVTGGAAATTADIAASANKNYVTDAQLTVLGNTSGTNTGDQTNVTGTAGNVTGIVAGANGGTGVANTGKTITLGGNLTTSGAFPTTLTSTAATTVTLPTTGTLATLAGTEALTNKTINGLTPTAAATGFTIAGGTTSKTLTVSDNTTVSGTNTGDNAVNSLYSGLVSNATHTGDVTGSTVLTIAPNIVSNADLNTVNTATIKGRATAGTGNVEDLTAAQVRTLLNVADGANNYVHPTGDGNLHVPATSTTNNGKVLTAGATAGSLSWTTPASGTVTSASVVTANGISGTVATANTTPAITLSLGAITPTSVASTGPVSGSDPNPGGIGVSGSSLDGTGVSGYSDGTNSGNAIGVEGTAISGIGVKAYVNGGTGLWIDVAAGSDPLHIGGLKAGTVTDEILTVESGGLVRKLPLSSISGGHTLDSHSNVSITANSAGEILKWNGSAWVNNTLAEAGIQPAGSYLTANQSISFAPAAGDVTGSTSGTTSLAPVLTIGNNKVTYAKMQTVTASRLLGNPTASAAIPSEITVGSGLNLSTGGVLTATGTGTVTAVSVASANGLTGTSSGGATPALTLGTSVTGMLKGNGTAVSAAVAGTDYLTPTGSAAQLTNFPTLNQNTTGNAATVTTNANMTGDVTSVGNVTSIAANVVSNADLNTVATATIKGRVSAGTGNVEDLTKSQVLALLNVADGANNYVHPTGDGNLHVPATSTTNNGKVLTAGATAGSLSWTTPATGTVTGVSVASANGLTGTSSGGATPALTLGTSVTGLMKGNGTAISAAVAGTDYQAPLVSGTSIKTINSTSLLGSGDIAITPNATHTGDVTGSTALTLATVNSNVGTFNNLTVNAKGLVTAASNVAYLTSETDATVKAINGLVKSNGTTVSAAVAGTDYLTPTGSAASLTGFPTFNQNTTGTASNVTGIVAGANGGTGVANTGKTITLGGNLTTSGAFPTTLTSTAATTVTLPTTGTLATLAGTEALTNKTINGLTPTAAATGFTIAGGTTSKTLTVPLDASVSGTNTGDNAVNSLYSGLVSNATHTGDVTGSTVLTIAPNVVSNADLNTVNTATIKGRATAGTGNVEDLTAAQVRTLLNVADGATNYTHPTGDGNLHVPATGTTNNGRVLTAGATAGSLSWTVPASGWSLTGNAATTPGTNFIGTTDDKDVVFKRYGILSGLLNNSLKNTSWGVSALKEGTTGNSNVATGYYALNLNTSGNQNIALGAYSLYNNTSGHRNVASGYQTLYFSTTATDNVAIGDQAIKANTTGSYNVAIGSGALTSNTTSGRNVAIGYNALNMNTTGFNNVGIGYWSLIYNTTGNNNISIGHEALRANTTGGGNTALGHQAGYGDGVDTKMQSVTDTYGTFVGYQASRAIVDNTTALTNITAIGYMAKVSQSNSLILGGSGGYAVSVGIGNTAPDASAVLDITSTTKGTLLPRMTTVQKNAIATPAEGLIVFDTDLNQLQVFNGTAWVTAIVSEVADEFTATAGQTSFTMTQTPSANSKVKMYINGIRISNTAYSKSGTTLTYIPANNGAYALVAGDRIQLDYYY